MRPLQRLAAPVLAGLSLLLAACENSGASYTIGGDKDHSISLMREQPVFWSDEVKQMIVVARFPACQKRFVIAPGRTGSVDLELYSVTDILFVARQGNSWWGIGTENCELQPFAAPPAQYGELVGRFNYRGDRLAFVAEPARP